MLSHEESVRLYGPWRRRTPADAAALLRKYPGYWWVAGGWAIDAFTKTTREHGDLDIGIPRDDLNGFVNFVSSHLDAWAAAGSLTPLVPSLGTAIPADCGNLWLRASGADPWEYDVMLESVKGLTWTYKRDPRITRPLTDCLWAEEGITYLRPEVQLLLKAKHARQKDTEDFERCLDHLDTPSLDWLTRTLRDQSPLHPWLEAL